MTAPKILIPFYSRTGTIEGLAKAVAEGAEAEGAEVRLRRARELVGHDILSSVPGWKESAEAMNARYAEPTAEDAVWADGLIFGTPTRFGAVASELKAYIDGLGGLWAKGALNGKAGSAFAGSATPHGGNEITSLSLYPVFAHLGLIIVPTGFADAAMFAGAGTPYGASVVSGNPPAGPTEAELAVARFQGRRVAQIARKLIA
ncbi:MAG TPA: NAD(P)H:quinone oxidoreductase [Rhizomicrobium sp.]|jgi:NAD(P)H dehydrogenase (quinone)|nr:NAD(P)H:quinone oxidoreductase [Rhizomicrobium sp.]